MDFILRNSDAIISVVLGTALLLLWLKRAAPARKRAFVGAAGVGLLLLGAGLFVYHHMHPGSIRWHEDWTAISPDGRFSIMIPKSPTESSYEGQTIAGSAQSRQWYAGKEPEQVSYIVRCSDLPAGKRFDDTDAAGKDFLTRISAQPGCTILDSSSITRDGHPGLVAHVSASGGTLRQTVQTFFTPGRQYVLMHTYKPNIVDSEGPFFSSFTILRD